MPEDVTKRLAVTFGTGLPHGKHARFKHEGKWWIAYPASKNRRILTGVDRMIGIYSSITDDMLRWINQWPEDGERVIRVLGSVNQGRKLYRELILEKSEASTE